jgi:outer membrane protein OmpA-like peptidoglycan-associated protein
MTFMHSMKAPGYVMAVALLAVGTTGCATKKYVSTQVDPVTARVSEVEQKANQTDTRLGELDERVQTDVSRLDERSRNNERLANEAGSAAKQANEAATGARTLAQESMTRIDGVEGRLSAMANSLGNYRMVAEDSVTFRFGQSKLTDEGKQALDQLVQQAGEKPIVIEVQGFTDPSGSAEYNMELSRKRANEVVRYLVNNHNVPLRQIFTMGMGKVEVEKGTRLTRDQRAQSRRVDVKVYVPEMEGVMPEAASTRAGS